jgi:type VI secretion system secreted protein VgrG
MAISIDAHARFVSPLGDQLLFRRMEGEEELGRPFKYDLLLLSESGDLVLSDLLGQVVTVELDLPFTPATPNDGVRYFNGYVTRFSRQGVHRDYHVYSATVRPWLWLLSQPSNCRIFQNKTIPDIIKEVFRGHGLTDFQESLTGDYSPRDYVVQYRETDFNFVSRLMEGHGIYYFFTHQSDKHTLVLADSYGAHQKVNGYEEVPYVRPGSLQQSLPDHIDDWESGQQIEPGTVVLNDFNFETPKANLLVTRSAPNSHEKADFERYDYPGEYPKRSEGEVLARLRFEELNVQYEQARGTGNAKGLTTGSLFELSGYPIDSENREYLITGTTFTIEGPQYESQGGSGDTEIFRCSFATVDSKCPFRTQPGTPRPTVAGPQTAIVVGKDGEDIWTDEYGRVKVQFHWDREGNDDENSSCWVRVAQMWAGAKFGAINIPRIGDEVIVDFLEGDPDRPIITGRVYNADNMPPYTLPDNKTQTGIKTRSSKGGNPDNFNEIRFEDKKGKEELHIQAEREMSTHVKRNQSTSVDGDQTITVIGNQSVTIQGKGKSPVHSTTSVTGKHTFDASDTIKIQAPTSITLECGGSSIVMVPGTITFTAGGGASIVLDANVLAAANAKAKVLLDANVLAQSDGGAKVLLDANVLAEANGKAKIVLDANVLAQSSGNSKVVLDGDATMEGTGMATVKGTSEATLTATGAVKTSPAGVEATGTKIDITGSAAVNVTGAMVKIN